MPSPVIPPALKQGDTVAFVSLSLRANNLLSAAIERAESVFANRGYNVRVLFTPDSGVQSCIANRLSELRAAFLDPDVKAIVCTIGGGSFTELVPALVADKELHASIRAHPKSVVGLSDMTGLHFLLYACAGLRTFYGPSAIPELGTADDVSDEATPRAFCVRNLFRAIANPEPLGDLPRSPTYASNDPPFFKDASSTELQTVEPAPKWTWLRPGKGKGRLFGGCLDVVARLNGIPELRPDWHGRIVFIETSMMNAAAVNVVRHGVADLLAQGVFKDIVGLVVGRPAGYNSDEERDKYQRAITELLCEGPLAEVENQFPILFNVDIGHTTPMLTLPMDALAELDSERDMFAVLEAGVV